MQKKIIEDFNYYPKGFSNVTPKTGRTKFHKQYFPVLIGTGATITAIVPSEGSDVQISTERYQYPEISTLEDEILTNKATISNLQNNLLRLRETVESQKIEMFAIKQNLNLEKIYRFASYKENWDGYGSPPIEKSVIEQSIKFIFDKNLKTQPSVFPTGRGSIQFEFEPDENHYMEIEIFQNNINCLSIIDSKEEELNNLDWEKIILKINDFQSRFYS
jgi:hypothetical protein